MDEKATVFLPFVQALNGETCFADSPSGCFKHPQHAQPRTTGLNFPPPELVDKRLPEDARRAQLFEVLLETFMD
jgi:hypothetical protein